MQKLKKSHFLLIILIMGIIFVSPNVYAGSCPLGPDVTKDLYGALKIIRIVAPLLVIVYSTLDTVKALTKGDGGAEFKKVVQRFGKRAIYAVILFFLPMIINIFMQMADVWDANGNCMEDLENPGSTSGNPSITTKSPEQTCREQGKTWDIANHRCVDSSEYTRCKQFGGLIMSDDQRDKCVQAGCTYVWESGQCYPK
ncbi:MAG: hypothetical protein K2L98_01690 [Bacilli bacterium]|nr:hypothetical protein [Bacilli bacterium]